MELIDVEAFSKEMKKRYCTNCDSYNGVRCRACWVDDMISDVEDFPTVDAKPVRHGHWKSFYGEFIRLDVDGNVVCIDAYCSICGEHLGGSGEYAVSGDYCPCCGNPMDEEVNNGR